MCTPSKISWKTVGKCLRHIHLCEQIVCQTHQKPTPHPQPFSANLLTRRTFIHLQIPSYVFTIGIRAILSEEMYNRADTVTTVRKLQETFQKKFIFSSKKMLAAILLTKVVPNIPQLCIFEVGWWGSWLWKFVTVRSVTWHPITIS